MATPVGEDTDRRGRSEIPSRNLGASCYTLFPRSSASAQNAASASGPTRRRSQGFPQSGAGDDVGAAAEDERGVKVLRRDPAE